MTCDTGAETRGRARCWPVIGQMSRTLSSHWPRRGHPEQCDITTVPQATIGGEGGKIYNCREECVTSLDTALRHLVLTKTTAIKKPLMRRFCLKRSVISKDYKEILMPDF